MFLCFGIFFQKARSVTVPKNPDKGQTPIKFRIKIDSLGQKIRKNLGIQPIKERLRQHQFENSPVSLFRPLAKPKIQLELMYRPEPMLIGFLELQLPQIDFIKHFQPVHGPSAVYRPVRGSFSLQDELKMFLIVNLLAFAAFHSHFQKDCTSTWNKSPFFCPPNEIGPSVSYERDTRAINPYP